MTVYMMEGGGGGGGCVRIHKILFRSISFFRAGF